jgi:hypothetical protein
MYIRDSAMDYYRLYDDINYPDRWYFGDINVPDQWIFSTGKFMDLKTFKDLKVGLDQPGEWLDYSTTDAYAVPIISSLMAECLSEFLDEIQLIPISVDTTKDKYYVLVVKNAINCVDENKSIFEKFEEGNPIRPDRVGEYQSIDVLKIDSRIITMDIFRVAKYEIALIISEKVKSQLDRFNLKGLKYELAI